MTAYEVLACAAGALTLATCVTMEVLIWVSYYLCEAQENCDVLPTISNTWTHPPMSYVSRFAVGNICDLLIICTLFIYWCIDADSKKTRAVSGPRGPATVYCPVSNEFLLHLSQLAIFCLSWVGAICDSAIDTCRGNNSIHTTFAVVWFAGFDLYMLLIHRQYAPVSTFRNVLVALSVLTKVRFALSLFALPEPISELLLAGFERFNVQVIMVWTVHTILTSETVKTLRFGAAYVQPTAANAPSTYPTDVVLNSVGARTLSKTAGALVLVCLTTTWLAAVASGTVDSGSIPHIADLFVYPPGNWISRWTLVQAFHMGLWAQVLLFIAEGVPSSSTGAAKSCSITRKLAALASVVGFAGLALLGVVNEDEDAQLHALGTLLYVVGFDVFMLTELVNNNRCSCTTKLTLVVLAAVSLGAQGACCLVELSSAEHHLAEWVIVLAITTFEMVDVSSHDETNNTIEAIMQVTDSQAKPAAETARELEIKLLTGEL